MDDGIAFINHARVRIAGCDVVALRHGMAGHCGVELAGLSKMVLRFVKLCCKSAKNMDFGRVA